jgi:polyphosphate glucokinase
VARQANKAARTGGRTAGAPRTLAIDIGGTGIKMLPVGADGESMAERVRQLTPRPAHPEPVLAVIAAMLAEQPPCDRVSVGFPGVVDRGVVKTAPNLDTAAWAGFDFGAAITKLSGRPTRVINDADLQGYGVIRGRGVELVLTFGTGMGSALYSDGHLVANLELGHHPFKNGKTYEERVCDAEAKHIGKKRFRARVKQVIAQLEPIFNYERLYLGGGNAKRLLAAELPANVELFRNEEGMEGGVRLWDDTFADES